MDPLKPYDPRSVCPKCGCEDASSCWCKAGEYLDISTGRSENKPERIFRKCERCEYGWHEAPLDSKA